MVSIIQGRRSLVLGVLTGCASGCLVECGGFAIGRLQVRISAWITSHQGLLSLPSLRDRQMSTSCGCKAKIGMAHSDRGWMCGCAGKTVRSLENTCHTWALLRWWFTTKRGYVKCMHLYLYAPLTSRKWEGEVRVCFDSLMSHSFIKTVVG